MPTGNTPPLSDLLFEVSNEMEAACGFDVPESVQPPIWVPLTITQDGNHYTSPDGRILSPQQAAIECQADELFFGGSPGGGKTDLLLGIATTVQYNSIIFRRQFTQLGGDEGLIERSKKIVGLRGQYDGGRHFWRDLPGGRRLEFAGCDRWTDVLKYQGRAHDFKGFDELPEFSEKAYRFLIGWLRTSRFGLRTRVIGSGNPPVTEEAQWVIRYWAPWLDKNHPNPAQPGELRWFVIGEDGKDVEVPDSKPYFIGGDAKCKHEHLSSLRKCLQCGGRFVNPRSRSFIRSSMEDNIHYARTNYADVLDALPEPLRSKMRYGDFKAAVADDEWQIFPSAWIDAAQERWNKHPGPNGTPLTMVGNDPSRGGQDEFAIALRYGEFFDRLITYPGSAAKDGVIGAQYLSKAVGGDRSVPINIDIGGSAGSSVYDHAKGLKLSARALDGSRKSRKRDKSGKMGFYNKRAERIWLFREMLDPDSGIEICLPPDPQMRADLLAMRWEPTLRGIKVEDKEEIKKRIGRSPDRGEAVIYASVLEDDGYGLVSSDASTNAASADEELEQLKKDLKIGRTNGGGNGHP